jgi:hypothetical protein
MADQDPQNEHPDDSNSADDYLSRFGWYVSEEPDEDPSKMTLSELKAELDKLNAKLEQYDSGSVEDDIEYEIAVEESRLREKTMEYERQLREFERAQRDREARSNFPAAGLDFRLELEHSPHLVEHIRHDTEWFRLIITIYGGFHDYGAHLVMPDIQRVAKFLSLPSDEQQSYLPFLQKEWKIRDKKQLLAHLRQYVAKEKEKQMALQGDNPVRFSPKNIYRKSHLTHIVLNALYQNASASDVADRAKPLITDASQPLEARRDAFLALVALKHEDIVELVEHLQEDDSQFAQYLSEQLMQRLDSLRDPLLRATMSDILGILNETQSDLEEHEWIDAVGAVIEASLQIADAPFNVLELLLEGTPTDLQRAYLLSELWAYYLVNRSTDQQLDFALLLDNHGETLAQSLEALATSISNLSLARNWKHHSQGGVIDIVHNRIGSKPGFSLVEVLNGVVNLPDEIAFFRTWLLEKLHPLITNEEDYELLIVLISLLNVGVATDRQEIMDLYKLEITRIHDLRDFIPYADAIQAPSYRFFAYYLLCRITPVFLREVEHRMLETFDQLDTPIEQVIALQQLNDTYTLIGHEGEQTPFMRLAAHIDEHETRAYCYANILQFPFAERADVLDKLADSICQIADPWYRSEVYVNVSSMLQQHPKHCERIIETFEEEWFIGKVQHHPSKVLNRLTPRITDAEHLDAWTSLTTAATLNDISKQLSASQSDIHFWEQLGTENHEMAVKHFLKRSLSHLIPLSHDVARILDRIIRNHQAGLLAHIFPILHKPDAGARSVLHTWLNDFSDKRPGWFAALYLAETRGLQAEHVAPLTALLDDSHDLARHRARHIVRNTRYGTKIENASELGLDLLLEIGRQRGRMYMRQPGQSLLFAWRLERIKLDDPDILKTLISLSDSTSADARPARYLIEGLQNLDEAVVPVIKEALLASTFETQEALIKLIAKNLAQNSGQISTGRWVELKQTIVECAQRNLEQGNIFPMWEAAYPHTVVDAIVHAVEESNMVHQQVQYAQESHYIRAPELFQIIVDEPDQLQALLREYGQLFFHSEKKNEAQLSEAANHLVKKEEYLRVLFAWLISALNTNIRDDGSSYLRMHLLDITAKAVELVPSTFSHLYGARSSALRIQYTLTNAVKFHNKFPGRRAAVKLLSYLKYLSPSVLEAFKVAFTDVYYVRDAAITSTSRFTNVSDEYMDELITFLKDDSAVVIHTTAEILSRISLKRRSDNVLRQRIVTALTEAIQEPYSKRGIYLSQYLPQPPVLSSELYRLLIDISGFVDIYAD